MAGTDKGADGRVEEIPKALGVVQQGWNVALLGASLETRKNWGWVVLGYEGMNI